MLNGGIHFNHAGPQFSVSDVGLAIEFYATVLGFQLDYVDGSPPLYAVVFRDEVYIHLSRKGHQPFDLGPGCAYVSIKGVDNLWAQIQAHDIEIIEPIREKDYGHGVLFRDFSIQDLDRNTLRIGEPLPSP